MTKQEVFKTFYEHQELIQVYNYRFFKQTKLLICSTLLDVILLFKTLKTMLKYLFTIVCGKYSLPHCILDGWD